MILAGVDGCRGGWIAVPHDRVRATSRTGTAAPTDLPAADLVAVDKLVGRPTAGAAAATDARRLLGPGRGRAFIGLRRPPLGFATYPEANAWGKWTARVGRRPGSLPKIAETTGR
jgi:hypothetical protein